MKTQQIIASIRNAWQGLYWAMRKERNVRIQILILVFAATLGAFFHIQKLEWVAILSCGAFVIGLEILNTSLETLSDKLHPNHDPMIGRVKDLAAGAVLVAAVLSAVIGGLIFIPYFLSYFNWR